MAMSSDRSDSADLTALLNQMLAGDAAAGDRAMRVLYDELHAMAVSRMRLEKSGHTLRPTALINDVWLRLRRGPVQVENRGHFMVLAAKTMRRVLVDHARQKHAEKRGGPELERVTLEGLPGEGSIKVDLLALDQALDELAVLDPVAGEIVQLRFFGGYTDREVCVLLNESHATVRRRWVFARSWLHTRLTLEIPA
jgi:RNA polymerase sigma factor (TIGR02999 family)